MTGLGVIGCGPHAVHSHIGPGVLTGFVLEALYDPLTEFAQDALREAGIALPKRVCSSAQEVVNCPQVKVVLITSPDAFHPEQLLMAVQAGKHVLVDKPLAISRKGMRIVRRALRIAARRGLLVTSCHPRRFDPPYEWVKTNVAQLTDRFGELIHVTLDFSYHEPSSDWKHARSLLLDHFPHEIDFLRWLLGNVSFTAQRLSDGPMGYGVAGTTATGVTFLCSGTRRLRNRLFTEQIVLRFAQGICVVGLRTGKDAAGEEKKTGQVVYYDYETQERTQEDVPPTDYDLRFLGIMRNLAQTLEEGAPHYLTPHDIFVNNEAANQLAWGRGGRYRYRAT